MSTPTLDDLAARVAALEQKALPGASALRTNLTTGAIKRSLRMSQCRPQPPRQLAFTENLLTWLPPQDDSGVTHYRIRVDHDGGDADFEVSAGQRSLQLFKGQTFTVSSYNNINGLESVKVGIGAGYGDNGNLGLGGPVGVITFSSMVISQLPANDFGLVLWMVRCNYSTNIKDLRGVAAWLENPSNTVPPGKIAEKPYVPLAANFISFALDAPADTRDVRVYLTPVMDVGTPQPVTVAAAGEDGASPHKTGPIGPIPQDARGVENCLNVTSPAVTTQTYTDSNGLLRTRLLVSFTPPVDSRWAAVELDAKRPGPIYETLGSISAPTAMPVESPSTSQTWRIFFRSIDTRGKINTLNEGTTGTPTPYVDVTMGTGAGTLDAAKIQQTTLSSALEIAANVLGIKPLGITNDLIGTFAVSQANLENAQIIDAARIVDGAITTAKIQNAAITNALIANAAVLEANIGDAQVTSAKIASLQVDKIAGWSGANIYVGSGMTFSTTNVATYIQPTGIETGAIACSSVLAVNSLGCLGDISGANIVASTGVFKSGTTQVVGARVGGWGTPTGTATRTTFDADTVTHQELARRLKALIDDLRTHGLIGN